MQHYSAPTRLIDLSDDPLTALWFAINEGKKAGVVYLIKSFSSGERGMPL